MEATALPTEPQPLPILKVTYRKGSNGKCTDGVDKNRLNLFLKSWNDKFICFYKFSDLHQESERGRFSQIRNFQFFEFPNLLRSSLLTPRLQVHRGKLFRQSGHGRGSQRRFKCTALIWPLPFLLSLWY